MTDEQKNWSVNDYADFWRYEFGVNVIPADTKNKRPKVEWKQFQHKAIPVELHNYWIKSGHKGTCYPNSADLKLHGWTAQGKE
jgi:hypothetical protein